MISNAHYFTLPFLNVSFYIRVWPVNNVVIVSGGQQRDSAIHESEKSKLLSRV